jgi:hypothetical protein
MKMINNQVQYVKYKILKIKELLIYRLMIIMLLLKCIKNCMDYVLHYFQFYKNFINISQDFRKPRKVNMIV